jgi:hypothetical protein
MAVIINDTILWDMLQCNLLHFRENRLCPSSALNGKSETKKESGKHSTWLDYFSTVKKDALFSSELSVKFFESTLSHNPEHNILKSSFLLLNSKKPCQELFLFSFKFPPML